MQRRCGDPAGHRRRDLHFHSCYCHCWGSSHSDSCRHFLFVRCRWCIFSHLCTWLLDFPTVLPLLIPCDKRHQEELRCADVQCFSSCEHAYMVIKFARAVGRSEPFTDSRWIMAQSGPALACSGGVYKHTLWIIINHQFHESSCSTKHLRYDQQHLNSAVDTAVTTYPRASAVRWSDQHRCWPLPA